MSYEFFIDDPKGIHRNGVAHAVGCDQGNGPQMLYLTDDELDGYSQEASLRSLP